MSFRLIGPTAIAALVLPMLAVPSLARDYQAPGERSGSSSRCVIQPSTTPAGKWAAPIVRCTDTNATAVASNSTNCHTHAPGGRWAPSAPIAQCAAGVGMASNQGMSAETAGGEQ